MVGVEHRLIPVACTLTPTAAVDQLWEWSDLVRVATRVDHLDDGVAIVLPIDHVDAVRDLAGREATCCAFLDIDVAVDDAAATVTITSPNPDALPVIGLIAGGR